jgi:hypothetical protein
MKKAMVILNCLVVVACAASVSHNPAVKPDQTAAKAVPGTVVFYNVENLFDTTDDPGPGDDEFTPDGKSTWTNERYDHKLHQLAEAIGMAGEELPLMIGLSEVENRKVVEDLGEDAAIGSGPLRHRSSGFSG